MMFDSTCNVALTAQEEQLTHIQQQKIEDQFIDKKRKFDLYYSDPEQQATICFSPR